MASKENFGRVRHLNLATQQRRLRHLRSIAARNISSQFSSRGQALVERLLEAYFTIHIDDNNQNAIYKSEKISYSLNPTWTSFEPSAWPDEINKAATSIIIRIWGVQQSTEQLVIEWKVHLPSLKFLGDQIRNSQHKTNTLIFGLVDGYYGAPDMHTKLASNTTGKTTPNTRLHAVKTDQEQVRPSYSRASVLRLHTIQKAIRQTRLAVAEACSLIEDDVKSAKSCTTQLEEEELLRLKLKLLKEELALKQTSLKKERAEEQKNLERLREKGKNLERDKALLEHSKRSLREHRQAHNDRREALVKLNAKLTIRRRQLVAELKYIYPIVPHSETKDLLISGVRLPNSESDKFIAMDEESLSVAIGNVCHLVSTIAKLLELPLRYPMTPRGSRSTITDFAIDKVADKDRQFPLSTKGKEKVQFNYGVYLLNKNIAQLRQYCGMGTPNLRNTLPNLKELLDTKFQVSGPVKSPPVPIIKRWPAKTSKPNSNSSPSSSPQTPGLDDVLLRTMMAAPADTKPGQSQAPSNPSAVQHPDNSGIQVGAKARASTEGDFKIPAQSAPHRFLTSKKSKGSDTTHTRSASNASVKSKDSDQTNHFVGRPSGLAQQISSEFEHVDIGELSGLNCEVGNTKDLDIVNIELEAATSVVSAKSADSDSAQNQSAERATNVPNVLEHDDFRFELQENGEIDLR